MAATLAAARLTQAHRLAQLRIGARTIAQLLAVWPLLDLDDIEGTLERWLEAVTPIVGQQRATSARLAATYVSTFRSLELGLTGATSRFTPALAETVEPARLATSMLVTGPVSLRAAVSRGVSAGNAVDVARARTAAAGMRHALNGGRDTITGSVAADNKAIGWARVTGGNTCAFCAMLASRGPVYKTETVDFRAHDHCACAAEPVYRDDAAWPAGARRYRDLWNTATSDVHGPKAQRAAFRLAYDAS